MGYIERLIKKVKDTNCTTTLGNYTASAFSLPSKKVTTIYISHNNMNLLTIEIEDNEIKEYTYIATSALSIYGSNRRVLREVEKLNLLEMKL